MQDDYADLYGGTKPPKKKPDDDYADLYGAATPPPAERPNFLSRSASALGEMVKHPVDAAVGIAKGIGTNVKDLVALSEAGRGNLGMVQQAIADETAKGGDAEQRLKLRALGAASLAVPALRVGGATTTFLANTAANAGLGAAQTPDDPAVGATLGALVPHGIALAGKATGALARRAAQTVNPIDGLNLTGVLDEAKVAPWRRTRAAVSGEGKIKAPKLKPSEADFGRTLDDLLASRTLKGEDVSWVKPAADELTVKPSAPRAPAASEAFPEGYQAVLDAPLAEVRAVPGAGVDGRKTVFVDPEVRDSRVSEERILNAEQRDAEARMTKEVRALDKAAAKAKPETAQGMLNVANAAYSRKERGKLAAQAALARRRGLPVEAPVTPTIDAPAALDAPLTPPIAAPIGEPSPVPVTPSAGLVEPPVVPPTVGVDAPAPPMPPADAPFLNWRTLGVDPSKPDALSLNVGARVKAAAERPEMAARLAAERGKSNWGAMNEKAQKFWVIQQLGIDPLSVDSNKMRGLSGEQIHALKAPLLENAGLMEGIARELPNLSGDDLAKAQSTFDALERSNDELLATIQREGSARGRDLNALRQTAAMTTDPAVWLVKAKRVLGDRPMTAEIQANILRLAKEAADACGGG